MRMIYGNTPVKTMNVRHFEINTNDCSIVPSDLQAGVTCFAKGQKMTGTGKAFEFANYGTLQTNLPRYVPSSINIIEVCSTEHPVKLLSPLNNMWNADFSTDITVAVVVIDGVEYDLSVSVKSNLLTIKCDKTISLEVFLGKDNYIR